MAPVPLFEVPCQPDAPSEIVLRYHALVRSLQGGVVSRVVIIGGGLTGLSAAALLHARGAIGGKAEVVVLESSQQLGGLSNSRGGTGRIFDQGPLGWGGSRGMQALLELLDLEHKVVSSAPVLDRLWLAPEEGAAVPLNFSALARTRAVSPLVRCRAMVEPFVAAGTVDGDTSAGAFLARRFGPRFVQAVLGPMLRARFGTHPDGINLQAALPLFWELGRNRQSVAVAATRGEVPWATLCVEALEHLQGREHTESGGAAVLNSLPGGVGELVHALTDILGERVRTGVEVQALERRRNRWLVHTDQGIHEAVSVVLACTGTAQAPLVSGLDPELGELLRSIPYAPMAVVSGAWPAGAWGRAPSGMGMVYPLDGPVLASWFTTCLFPDHGPEGEVLVQTLLGGAEHADVVDRSDHELVELTRSALLRSLGRERVEPLDHAVVRHRSALPLLRRGHLGRVRALRAAEARYAGLFFAGPHVYGTGIDHCTDGALQTVNQVVSWIESEASRKHPSGEFLLGAGRAG